MGAGGVEDALFALFFPEHDAAVYTAEAGGGRGEAPEFFAGGGVESDGVEGGGSGVEDAVDDDGGALDGGAAAGVGVAGFVFPGDFELLDVGFVDLGEGGEAVTVVRAGPGSPVLLGEEESGEEEEREGAHGLLGTTLSGIGWGVGGAYYA